MSRRLRRQAFVAASAVVFSWSIVDAQEPPAAPRADGAPAAAAPRNLQVLAKDTPAAQVTQTMQAFTAALGVQCTHCHAQPAAAAGGRGGGGGRGGRGGGGALDFASDEKPQKKVARDMMLMVRDLRARVAAAVDRPVDDVTEVTCLTCHRGVPVPRPLPAILDQTAKEKGTSAAIAHYKELRKQFFGGQAYDFTHGMLVAYAQRAAQAQPADAIAWLRLNLEYFPLSSPTYVALAQAYQKTNDRDAAVRALERAVELDPQNAQTKRQLDQLKGTAAAPTSPK